MLAAGLLVTAIAYETLRASEREATQLRFDRRVDDAVGGMAERMEQYERLLRAGVGLFAASTAVDRAEWRAFAESMRLEEQYPGLQGFGYAELIAPQALRAHEAKVRAEGFADYSVRPDGVRAQYTSIVYLEPFAGRNLKAFGFDMYSEPVRREAMDRAAGTGAPALSGTVQLVQEGSGRPQAGTLMYVPVYRKGLPLHTESQRRSALQGFVYAPFRMDDLGHAAMRQHLGDMAFELHDGPVADGRSLMHAQRRDVLAQIPGYQPSFDVTRTMEVGQRTWTLRFTTLPAFDAALPARRSPLAAAAGLGLTLLACGLLAVLMNTRLRANALAERMSRAHRESEAKVRSVLQGSAEGILITDAGAHVLSVNPAVEALLGCSAAELVGQSIEQRLTAVDGPDATQPLLARLSDLHAGRQSTLRCLAHARHAVDGRELTIRVSATVVEQDGERRLIVMLSDLTELKLAERTAREASALNAAILDSAPFCVIATDTSGLITSINPAGEKMLWYRRDELVGRRTPMKLLRADELALAAEQLSEELGRPVSGLEVLTAKAQRGIVEEREWICVRKDGSQLPVNLAVTALHGVAGEITGFLGIAYDITERKRSEDYIRHLAHHDALTGLPNRTLMADRVHMAIERAKRGNSQVGVMLLDLDHFKRINDSLGHHVGDEVLRTAAERLRTTVRQVDTVARMGGDEFVIVLGDLTSREDAATVAEKVARALAVPMQVAQHTLHMSASIGVAVYPDDGQDLATLMQNADAAMYETKSRGRNGHTLFAEALREASDERLGLESGLRRAIDRGELALHYQPIVRLDNGQALAVEALLRWQHPHRGEVSPAQFIPVAEETGLIVPIGDWVLRTACADLARLRQQQDGAQALRVAVNLSPRQFRQRDLLDTVQQALAGARLPADALELEITESMLMEDPVQARAVLEGLRALGVQLAIDDFGTGHSSLSYLSRFPVDTLKLDRSFVHNITADGEDAAIAQAVIQLGRSLALDVVAEGVETDAQSRYLRQRGCAFAQGFLFSRALPVPALTDWLARQCDAQAALASA